MSEYKISTTWVGNMLMYQVYCLIDPTKPDTEGNRDVAATYSRESLAQILVNALNGEKA